jgi:hypothetical protein
MAVKFQVGTSVVQVMPEPIRGEIVRFIFDETSGDVRYVIADDTGHESTFHEDDIEVE